MKTSLAVIVGMILGFSNLAFTADAKGDGENLLFIGNPGVGKSTLINSLLGQNVAEAGVNPGVGLTKFFSCYPFEGNNYLDTPGLSDVQMRERAAREIETALKKNGKYRIFFVVTLQAGRVKPEDVASINTVMDAIKNPVNAGFNILINQLSKKEMNQIFADPVKMAQVYTQLNSGKHKTDSIWYLEADREVEDGIKEFPALNTKFRDFIYQTSLAINIDEKDVEAIKTDEYESLKAELTETISELQKQIAAGDARYADLVRQMQQLIDEQKKEPKAAAQEVHHHHHKSSCTVS